MRDKIIIPNAYYYFLDRGLMGEGIFLDNKSKGNFLTNKMSQCQRPGLILRYFNERTEI
ncbi:hypothetical protein KAW48_00810 [candidate division WOR-3 bacterium]|nr:hypothetical protein [candidate division WOR-3 bacterium]